MKKYILAIDQGTTSSRAILFNKQGEICNIASCPVTQIYPSPGCVEHNPEDIFSGTFKAIRKIISSIDPNEIDSIGITNQRETTIIWDKTTGEPIYNAIVWQCRRTSKLCDLYKSKGYEDLIYKKTGLFIDPYFSATKIKWILDNVEFARKKANNHQLLFGTVDTYILWKLTKGKVYATDYTNASRTMLFNIHTLSWDSELCELFDIPMDMLPKVYPSGHFYGMSDSEYFDIPIPINALCGDQQSALFGQCCFDRGDVKNTYGTGCFLLMNTGKYPIKSSRGLITSLTACIDKPNFALEGSVFVAGAGVQWLRDELGFIDSAEQSEQIATSILDSEGVYVVPAFVGLGAPHWDSKARGLICGLTRGTTKAHIVRATLEAIDYQVFDVLHAMERDMGYKINTLKVDGGASRNDFLMQFQSDIMNADVIRPDNIETTALGVCYLAGLISGFYKDTDEIKKIAKVDKVFSPVMKERLRNQKIMGWEDAILRTKLK